MARIALIGASGLVGSQLVPLLHQESLLSLARRSTLTRQAHWEERIGPMETWPDMLRGERVDRAVAAFGTTRRKTPDWESYEAIDRHAIAAFAKAARQAGARQLVVVSSVGADAKSGSRYLAIKGRMEADVRALGFARVDIFRPGLLIGARDEMRIMERLGMLAAPALNMLLRGRLAKYQAIKAEDVAKAMRAVLSAREEGVFVHHNRDIRRLAHQAVT